MSTETPTVTNEPVEYYTPDVEIFEDNEALTVTADLPGERCRGSGTIRAHWNPAWKIDDA